MFIVLIGCILAVTCLWGCDGQGDSEGNPSGNKNDARGGGDDGGSGICDPLKPNVNDAELDWVFAVGQTEDGTVYVSDYSTRYEETRLYVSEGDKLVMLDRDEETAFGGTCAEDGDSCQNEHNLTINDTSHLLGIERTETGEVSMVLAEGGGDEPFDELMARGAPLTILTADDIADFDVQGIALKTEVQHFGQLENGDMVLVVYAQDHDYEVENVYRLFYGPPSEMKQYVVEEIEEDSGGNDPIWSTTLDDGSSFAVGKFESDSYQDRAFIQTTDGERQELLMTTYDVEDHPLDNYEFICLSAD